MSAPRTRRRDKQDPDPTVRREILSGASKTLREQGVRGVSIAAILERTGLGTRAFYRHFASKDELVAAVFLDMARVEERRLRRRMASATTEIDAVAAWVDGRLDLAFNANIRSDLRRVSLEAQSQMFASPNLVQPAYAELLKPLSEVLQRGLQHGVFHDIDPVTDAQVVHAVVWAGIERQWRTADCDRDDIRRRALRFCLRGLGVTTDAIAQVSL
ncbi:MAG: TetR/AcrR family transcriptional regulator [Mycobacterium sp.]|uniref:TetR/AcrR family transcriptional regulator n=1 Tax=Mycobacterium sp. TaxID=1785 RepID=UPI003F99D22A